MDGYLSHVKELCPADQEAIRYHESGHGETGFQDEEYLFFRQPGSRVLEDVDILKLVVVLSCFTRQEGSFGHSVGRLLQKTTRIISRTWVKFGS